MTDPDYFQKEYEYLEKVGRQFKEKHPAIGGLLGLDEKEQKDPFVERLLEGFAFLTGRIQERLDDDFPELAGALLEQLFPHLLRPFPSCAMLQVSVLKSGTEYKEIPRDSIVQTPTGKVKIEYDVPAAPGDRRISITKKESAEFIFRTTRPLTVHPMQLKRVSLKTGEDIPSALSFRFELNRNADYASLGLARLSLFINNLRHKGYTLLHYLLNHVQSVWVREATGRNTPFFEIEGFRFELAALSENPLQAGSHHESQSTALVPYTRQAFSGYRLLQEYFAFPQQFFLVDLLGLEQYEGSKDGHPIELKIEFSKKLPSDLRVEREDIEINCVPVVNLFDSKTEPIRLDHKRAEYYVVPDKDRRKSREIYSINGVTGFGDENQVEFIYSPITSRSPLNTDSRHRYDRFFSVSLRPAKSDMGDAFVRLFGVGIEESSFQKESLSIDATFSNGFLPKSKVQVGDISEPVDFPEGVTVTNISEPSPVLHSPERSNYMWALITHLNASYTTLADKGVFKEFLGLYNWSTRPHDERKIEQGILHVYRPESRVIHMDRGLLRGIEFRIDIDGQCFHGEGDIHLFGLVLSHFLAQYTTINSFVVLKFIDKGNKDREYTWDPKKGKTFPV